MTSHSLDLIRLAIDRTPFGDSDAVVSAARTVSFGWCERDRARLAASLAWSAATFAMFMTDKQREAALAFLAVLADAVELAATLEAGVGSE